MTQYARPAVVSGSGWGGAASDIADASGVNDATACVSTPGSSQPLVVSIPSVIDPETRDGYVLRGRGRKSGSGGDKIDITIEVRHPDTNALLFSKAVTDISDSLSDWVFPLSAVEAALIPTGRSNLRVIPSVTIAPPETGYFVSPSGDATDSQATYNAAANPATPCAKSVAFKYAVAGDVVYFRGGLYSQAPTYTGPPTSTPNKPANSGTLGNPIIFRNYPGETPIWNADIRLNSTETNFWTGINSGANYGVEITSPNGLIPSGNYPANQAVVLAVVYKNYITIDGFTFQANGGTKLGVPQLNIYGSTGITVQNCTFKSAAMLPSVYLPDANYGATAINNSGGYAAGSTSIVVDGWNYLPGLPKWITIAGHAGDYSITAATTLTGGVSTLTITPGLAEDVHDDDAVAAYTAHYDNTEFLRFDQIKDLTIRNNRFEGITCGWKNHNESALKSYGNRAPTYGGFTIENNDFIDCDFPIYLKGGNDDGIIRNNFMLRVGLAAVLNNPDFASMESNRIQVLNNLIVRNRAGVTSCNGIGMEGDVNHDNDWVIANNTLYYAGITHGESVGIMGGCQEAGHGWHVYDNIIYGTAGFWTGANGVIATEDHNQWGNDTTPQVGWQYHRNGTPNTRDTSLATWQARAYLEGGGSPGVGDLVSNPLFVDGSGTLSEITDFALQASSPCLTGGRNGGRMGCDVTQVGRGNGA